MQIYKQHAFILCYPLSGNDIYRHIEDLRNLQDCVNVSAGRCREMMGRAALAPAVYELSRSAGEAGSHVGIAEGKDLSLLVYALCHNEFEMSVSVLGDCEVGHRS